MALIILFALPSRAVELNLNRNNLKELPPTIGQCANLRELYVRYNQLGPSCHHRASCLLSWLFRVAGSRGSSVILSSGMQKQGSRNPPCFLCPNNQSEYLPDEIGDCSNLETLNVGHNSIEELPASLGRLSKLERLKVQIGWWWMVDGALS